MNNRFYVILKKYTPLNLTTVCLKYGKTAKFGATFDSSDCFESKKYAEDMVNHFYMLGSSTRYKVVDAQYAGIVNINK